MSELNGQRRIGKKRSVAWIALAGFFVALLGTSAQANMYIYPSKGQSQQQQQKDEQDCHQWAQQQSGVNPQQVAEQATSLAAFQQPQGGMGRALFGGSGRGAALGAVGGAIGGDAGKGAEIGAAVGALGGFMRHRRMMEEQHEFNAAVAQSQQAAMGQFQRAYETCLRGRGYTVSP